MGDEEGVEGGAHHHGDDDEPRLVVSVRRRLAVPNADHVRHPAVQGVGITAPYCDVGMLGVCRV